MCYAARIGGDREWRHRSQFALLLICILATGCTERTNTLLGTDAVSNGTLDSSGGVPQMDTLDLRDEDDPTPASTRVCQPPTATTSLCQMYARCVRI